MRRLAPFALSILVACASEAPEADVCDLAARHIEACLGRYITPPICDDAGQQQAERVLDASCEQIAQLDQLAADGKADGATCDWFGLGCTPDEAIFTGAACDDDRDCDTGRCVEEHCFAGVASAEMTSILDDWTGSRELGGNSATLLAANPDAFATRLALIESATTTLHVSTFYFKDDAPSRQLIAALEAAARRGVEVRVLVDAYTQYTGDGYRLLNGLRLAGGEILPYNPVVEWAVVRASDPLTPNDRLHAKVIVADGARALVGGRNFSKKYMLAGAWRDTDVQVAGPAVADVQLVFLSMWDEASALERRAGCPQELAWGFYCPSSDARLAFDARFYPDVAERGDVTSRAILSDPRVQETPLGYLATLALVRAATTSIEISNAYFVPPSRLRKHLAAAARRGVKVTVVTNSRTSSDTSAVYYAGLNFYEELIGAGVEIREYRGEQTLHSKTMVVDGELAIVGSYNLDPRSAVDNTETFLVLRGPALVGALRQAIAADAANADAHSGDLSTADWLRAKAARIIEPLL